MDKKKVTVRKRRGKKKVVPKPKKQPTQRQTQKQTVNQKVIVNVQRPKISRRKTGRNPAKPVRLSMTHFYGEPTHLYRPTYNPYDALFRNINSPLKPPNPNVPISMATADPDAVRRVRIEALDNKRPEGGVVAKKKMIDVKPSTTGSLDIVKSEPIQTPSPRRSLLSSDGLYPSKDSPFRDPQENLNIAQQSSSSVAFSRPRAKRQDDVEPEMTVKDMMYKNLDDNISKFMVGQKIMWKDNASEIKRLTGKKDIDKLKAGYNNWKQRKK